MSHQVRSIARLLGNSYAHLQHGIDRAIEWGFHTMRSQADAAPTKKASRGPAGVVLSVGKGLMGFLGTAGDAYFRTYGELKKKG